MKDNDISDEIQPPVPLLVISCDYHSIDPDTDKIVATVDVTDGEANIILEVLSKTEEDEENYGKAEQMLEIEAYNYSHSDNPNPFEIDEAFDTLSYFGLEEYVVDMHLDKIKRDSSVTYCISLQALQPSDDDGQREMPFETYVMSITIPYGKYVASYYCLNGDYLVVNVPDKAIYSVIVRNNEGDIELGGRDAKIVVSAVLKSLYGIVDNDLLEEANNIVEKYRRDMYKPPEIQLSLF